MAELADGRCEMFESPCNSAPAAATDAQVLAGLAAETGEDFAARGVVRFAVGYLANRVTKTRPLDPNAPQQPTTTRRQGVVIELHGADEHLRIFREIIRLPGRAPMLGAASELAPDTDSGLYTAVLDVRACKAVMYQLIGPP